MDLVPVRAVEVPQQQMLLEQSRHQPHLGVVPGYDAAIAMVDLVEELDDVQGLGREVVGDLADDLAMSSEVTGRDSDLRRIRLIRAFSSVNRSRRCPPEAAITWSRSSSVSPKTCLTGRRRPTTSRSCRLLASTVGSLTSGPTPRDLTDGTGTGTRPS